MGGSKHAETPCAKLHTGFADHVKQPAGTWLMSAWASCSTARANNSMQISFLYRALKLHSMLVDGSCTLTQQQIRLPALSYITADGVRRMPTQLCGRSLARRWHAVWRSSAGRLGVT